MGRGGVTDLGTSLLLFISWQTFLYFLAVYLWPDLITITCLPPPPHPASKDPSPEGYCRETISHPQSKTVLITPHPTIARHHENGSHVSRVQHPRSCRPR
ncbi:hypothetical protein J6590_016382 [Homalodisca vitripennis]|nr:hypothetical protein J6590_016382 [Homalodisca vitripennis]